MLLGFVSVQAYAQKEFFGKITYLTSTMAYVNLGTNQGFDVGDTLRVVKKDKQTASLRIATIATKSLSATILTKSGDLREGDEVHGTTYRAPVRPASIMIRDTTVPPIPKQAQTALLPSSVTLPASVNIIHGRIGAQYYGMFVRGQSSMAYNQPAGTISFTGEKLFDAPFGFSFYSNSRYSLTSNSQQTGVSNGQLSNRIYDASVKYGGDADRFASIIGRFVLPMIGGVGTFDGVSARWKQDGFQAGFAGGTQPDWLNSSVDLTNPKFAAFFGYDKGDYSAPVQYQGSLAFAQQYYHHNLDRGFIFFQNMLNLPGVVSLYQTADVDLHDVTAGGRAVSPHLTDAFLSANLRPLTWLSGSISYSTQRSIYFLESFRGIPDSLFDKSFLHNGQVSLGLRLPAFMFVTINGSFRKKESDPKSSPSLMVNYSWSNIVGTDIGMYVNGAWADNIYYKMQSLGLDFHTELFQSLYLSVKGNFYRYQYLVTNVAMEKTSYGIDGYYRVSKSLYATLSYERYAESAMTTDRVYLEMSVRF